MKPPNLTKIIIPHALITCIPLATLNAATIGVTPTYSHFATDFTWTDNGGGNFTVPTAAEDYDNEIWERPIEDDKWNDAGGVRTATGKYYAYNDIASAKFGWNDDYAFASITVVGGYVQDGDDKDFGVGLKGHYYVYFSDSPQGADGFLFELSDGTAADGDLTNGITQLFGDSNGDVGGTGLTNTGESVLSDGFESALGSDHLYARAIDGGNGNGIDTIEFALDLNNTAVTTEMLENLQFLRLGVATSNPSAPSDLLANDEFGSGIGSGVEYDTVGIDIQGSGPNIPEPSTSALTTLGLLGFLLRRNRKS